MEKALEFSYQTGKFASKAGGFNKLADVFISTASKNIPFSSIVPFPRYLVNQLIFQYRSEERRVGKECRSRWSQ